MSPTSRVRPASLLASASLAFALALTGCNDSIECVFTTGCGPGGGTSPLASEPAILPEDGAWIRDGVPMLQDVFPAGQDAHPETPIVLVFSESMNPDTLAGAFDVVPFAGPIPMPPLMDVEEVLVGDGRVLVLLPGMPLDEGNVHSVRLSQQALVTDVTGQELGLAPGIEVGSFAVTIDPPAEPRLIASWPPDGSDDQSDTTQIVAVFDRDMNAGTVSDASFDVQVEGVDPVPDPAPRALSVSSGVDPRVFLYRSEDGSGVPSRLGSDASVEVTLSPAATPILDGMGQALPETVIGFTTIPFATPLSAGLLSEPIDAIGVRNLTAGNDEELLIQVDLADAEPNDQLDLFVFGTDPDTMPPQLAALTRSITLGGTAPILTGQFMLADVPLLVSSVPTDTRFQDGPVSFAFRLRRGSVVSPLRVLDVDVDAPGIQDPVLDTVGPEITELLFPGGGTGTFDSDMGDVVITGRADEALRSVEVSTPLGDNGVLPPVVGSSEDGRFVAAPVAITGGGLVPGGTTTYVVTAYDSALNASAAVNGVFRQRGVVGPGGFTPGDTLEVEVFHAENLDPLGGVGVFVHADRGDGTYPFTISGTTNADGCISLATDGSAGVVGALVTVDAAGFDLFTFHGVPSARISIPLRPAGAGADASVRGAMQTSDSAARALLPGLDHKLSDSRRPFLDVPRTYPDGSCIDLGVLSCLYGPEPILRGRLGAQSFLAGRLDLNQASFSAATALQAFCLSIPVGPVFGSAPDDTSFELPFLITDPTVSSTEFPIDVPAVTLRADLATGIDVLDLDSDPVTRGAPFVTVESLVPGVPGSVASGVGLSYSLMADTWDVRSAYAGAVSPAGFFGSSGAVDPDPFVRFELRDLSGNVSGVRTRVGGLAPMSPNIVFSSNVPQLLSPAPGGSSGGASFDVRFDNALPDVAGIPGLYRVQLEDETGRGWELWRVDPAGSADVVVHVPNIASQGGAPLQSGQIDARVGFFGWAGLDPTAFLWTDVERIHERYGRSGVQTFTQP